MGKKYIVMLSDPEEEMLNDLIKSGTQRVRKVTHAHILLKANAGWMDQQISRAVNVSVPTIVRVRQRFVEEGVDQALQPRQTSRKYEYLLDGVQEAHLIALTCSRPPAGHRRWSLRLLAGQMVRLEYVDDISHETVRQVMQANELKPWLKKEWCIPPKHSAEFVYYMEDVLDVYHRPCDPLFPIVCFDETPVQLVSEIRQPIPMKRGKPACYDFEYRREGTANLFMFFAPLQNWRHIKVTEHRTKADWAWCMRDLVDVYFPNAERCVVVEDQLNTHNPAALYEVFDPAEAKRILDRLEFHFTPKHGSWLNMAEIEFSVLSRQCLDGYIPNIATLERETLAWETERNSREATVEWRFTTADARIKLKKLYPIVHLNQNVKELPHIKA
ncbi:MAG: IS630 family transposase [Pseudomonadota bacterium]